MKKRETLRLFVLMILILIVVIVLLNVPTLLSLLGFALYPISEESIVESSLQDYDYEIANTNYKTYFKKIFAEKYTIKYAKGNVELDFSPFSVRYTAAQKYVQPINDAESVEAQVSENKVIYEGAFGDNIDVTYEVLAIELNQKILFGSSERFFVPDSRILTNNPEVEIEIPFSYNKEIFVNGNKWDKKTTMQANEIIFEHFSITPTTLTDAQGSTQVLSYELRRSGQSLFIVIKIPYSLVKDAAFPLEIDFSIITEAEEVPEVPIRGKGILLDVEFSDVGNNIQTLFTCKFFDSSLERNCEQELTKIGRIRLYQKANPDNFVDYLSLENWNQDENYDSKRKGWIIIINKAKYPAYDSININANYDTNTGIIGSGIVKSYS